MSGRIQDGAKKFARVGERKKGGPKYLCIRYAGIIFESSFSSIFLHMSLAKQIYQTQKHHCKKKIILDCMTVIRQYIYNVYKIQDGAERAPPCISFNTIGNILFSYTYPLLILMLFIYVWYIRIWWDKIVHYLNDTEWADSFSNRFGFFVPAERDIFFQMIKSHLRYEKHKKNPKVVRSYISEPQ